MTAKVFSGLALFCLTIQLAFPAPQYGAPQPAPAPQQAYPAPAPVRQCRTEYSTQWSSNYVEKPEQVCDTVYVDSCQTLQNCQEIPRQDCQTIQERQCTTEYQEVCTGGAYGTCEELPNEVCSNVPKQNCVTRTEKSCQPYQECNKVPKENCRTEVRREEVKVSRSVPREVCDDGQLNNGGGGYGGATSTGLRVAGDSETEAIAGVGIRSGGQEEAAGGPADDAIVFGD